MNGVSTFLRKIQRKRRILTCLLRSYRSRGRITGLKYINISVPLIADGQGKVQLDPHSSFGYREAPRIGAGEIFLHARHSNSKILIGEHCAFSNNVTICALDHIEIGSRCLIGDMVLVMDGDHHELEPSKRWDGAGVVQPVKIGHNVWIGSRSIILRGVEIGDNSVIGAGSVVTRSVPANVVAAGNPANIIRYLTAIGDKAAAE